MHLKDLERTDGRDYSHFVARVPDEAGVEEFELRIAGNRKLVEKAFSEATFDLTINSALDVSQVKQHLESANAEHRRSMWEVAGLADIDQMLKPIQPPPDPRASIFASARPVSGTGTPFVFTAGPLPVATGMRIFFVGPWVIGASGTVVPISGDQDLFLHLFSAVGPVVAASRLGGTATDTAWYANPFFPFVPVFEIFGYAAGVCGNFTAVGG